MVVLALPADARFGVPGLSADLCWLFLVITSSILFFPIEAKLFLSLVACY